ncbi:MAG: zinc finger domain-containing protein [Candidatus Marsarchaeota archaeon]|nr:zinc finger domain-containing protein [Candidatus Marsarchaeota archaeon]
MLPGKVCTSCGRLSHNYTDFECPKCGKSRIIRCEHCRRRSNTYLCKECEFEGP